MKFFQGGTMRLITRGTMSRLRKTTNRVCSRVSLTCVGIKKGVYAPAKDKGVEASYEAKETHLGKVLAGIHGDPAGAGGSPTTKIVCEVHRERRGGAGEGVQFPGARRRDQRLWRHGVGRADFLYV